MSDRWPVAARLPARILSQATALETAVMESIAATPQSALD
jgi:hypothetical protein